jgi:hypothetical protein
LTVHDQPHCPCRVVFQQQNHTLCERPTLNDVCGDEELTLAEVFFGVDAV